MPAPYARDEPVRVCGHPGSSVRSQGGPGDRSRFYEDRGVATETGRWVTLRGCGQQCRVLDELIADVPAGRSPVLVARGEPGIGKTALLGHAAETAQDFPGVSRRGPPNRRGSCRSRRCISYAGGCRAGWTGCPARSATRSGCRPACGRG